MLTRLIINADDFGMTPGINRAVGELFQAGALSSATLMANGAAFDEAAKMAHLLPGLGIGCHIVLVDGSPLSKPAKIPTLIEQNHSTLLTSLGSFARAALSGRLEESEIEVEAVAQVERLLDAGIVPTHLDTHKHTHLFPVVLRALLRVAERFRIAAIRNPFEPRWNFALGQGGHLRRAQMRVLGAMKPQFTNQFLQKATRVKTTDGGLGISATGQLDRHTIADVMRSLPSGNFELVCHPGYDDTELATISTRLRAHRNIEREALLELIPDALRKMANLKMISFQDL